jgi:hypothetical protein
MGALAEKEWLEGRRRQRAQIFTAPGAPHIAQGEKLKR